MLAQSCQRETDSGPRQSMVLGILTGVSSAFQATFKVKERLYLLMCFLFGYGQRRLHVFIL